MVAVPEGSVLVLDDYHLVDAEAVDRALAFLLEHLPPRMHLVIATREDPNLPLARLRAQRAAERAAGGRPAFHPYRRPSSFSPRGWASRSRRTTSRRWKPAPKAGSPACSWPHRPARGGFAARVARRQRLHQVLYRQPSIRHGLPPRRGPPAAARRASRPSCSAPRYSTACAVPCATPSWRPPPVPGRRPWHISSAPTCSSSPWTTSGAGTAITISSPIRCDSGCNQGLASSTGDRAEELPSCTCAPAPGTKQSGLEIEAFHHAVAAHDFRARRAPDRGQGNAPVLPRRPDPRAELAEVPADGGAGRPARSLDGLCLGHAGHGPGGGCQRETAGSRIRPGGRPAGWEDP